MKCIYNEKEEDQATFEKREHVFPAGIGGINMLNQGDVSDEINEFFSKLELQFMRESIIQIPRMFLGPGKRGSLNKKKSKKLDENTSVIGFNHDKKDESIYISQLSKIFFRGINKIFWRKKNIWKNKESVYKWKNEYFIRKRITNI